MDLPLHAADHRHRLAEVDLRMAGRMHQRHEHLLRRAAAARHVVLHDREAARKAVLVPQPLEDPLRRMPLLLGRRFVLGQDLVDDPDERIQLGPHRRLAAPVARRHRERIILRTVLRIDPEPPRRLALAQPLDLDRVANPRIQFHGFIPRPLPNAAKASSCRIFPPAQPTDSAASVRDFLSGAHSPCR